MGTDLAKSTRLYHRRRDAFIETRGGACERCGSNGALEIDHVDRSTKLLAPGDALMRRAEIRDAELAKCQVLCADCHKAKTRSEQKVPCGTSTACQRYGCRCADCKRWRRDSARKRRARRLYGD